jgi:hypothetical protein
MANYVFGNRLCLLENIQLSNGPKEQATSNAFRGSTQVSLGQGQAKDRGISYEEFEYSQKPQGLS